MVRRPGSGHFGCTLGIRCGHLASFTYLENGDVTSYASLTGSRIKHPDDWAKGMHNHAIKEKRNSLISPFYSSK